MSISDLRDMLNVTTMSLGLVIIVGQAAIGWATIQRLEKRDEQREAAINQIRSEVDYIRGRLNGEHR